MFIDTLMTVNLQYMLWATWKKEICIFFLFNQHEMIDILVTENSKIMNSLDVLAPQLIATATVRKKGGGGGGQKS
jgi:hypothetical protein